MVFKINTAVEERLRMQLNKSRGIKSELDMYKRVSAFAGIAVSVLMAPGVGILAIAGFVGNGNMPAERVRAGPGRALLVPLSIRLIASSDDKIRSIITTKGAEAMSPQP